MKLFLNLHQRISRTSSWAKEATQRPPLARVPITLIILFTGTFLLAGCSPFSHLTTIPPEGDKGPQASQCGECHVAQYQEWQGTAHARAFTSKTFQEAAGSPAEEECLQCHAPLGVHAGKAVARSFHRQEGVNCISCHLSQGKMHGPHKSSALFTPHPVAEENQFYLSPALCATCHEETATQWQKVAAGRKIRSCQECHQAEVQRRATEGTNILSKILVSFEQKVPTRSHEITLENMAHFPGAVTMTTRALNQGKDAPALEINIENNLPHDLPTGTFGDKDILLVLSFEKEGSEGETIQITVSDTQHPLAPEERKKVIVPLSPASITAKTVRLDLARHSIIPEHRPPIILFSTVIDAISEAFH